MAATAGFDVGAGVDWNRWGLVSLLVARKPVSWVLIGWEAQATRPWPLVGTNSGGRFVGPRRRVEPGRHDHLYAEPRELRHLPYCGHGRHTFPSHAHRAFERDQSSISAVPSR